MKEKIEKLKASIVEAPLKWVAIAALAGAALLHFGKKFLNRKKTFTR